MTAFDPRFWKPGPDPVAWDKEHPEIALYFYNKLGSTERESYWAEHWVRRADAVWRSPPMANLYTAVDFGCVRHESADLTE